jgi:hypothetical protein
MTWVNFFQTRKGLRQGDPLFPIFFNLVADMLAMLIEMSKNLGFFDGLVPHLVEDGLSFGSTQMILSCFWMMI